VIPRKPTRKATAQAQSIPSPIGGLNARDSVALMAETDAIVMDNMFPRTTDVVLRDGNEGHASFDGDCESLMAYQGALLTKLFAAVFDGSTYSLYDASGGGALSVAVVGGSGDTIQALSGSRFDYVNFGTIGGQFMLAVNAADTGLKYDGVNWASWTLTGVDTADLFTLGVYAERVWAGQKDSFNVWYLPVNQITGTAVQLNIASLFKLGGTLSNIVTWSADTASEIADFIAFVSTLGEVVAFSGTDPSDANNWRRVAQFQIGRTVAKGNRGWRKLGSEAILISVDGAVPLSKAVMTNRSDMSNSVTDKIRPLINRDVLNNGARYGWVLMLHASGSKLLLNVPTSESVSSYQYVMNTQTGAWCRFTGWNAFCFEVSLDTLYYGGANVIKKADVGTSDSGDSINADVKQAFSYLGRRGQQKRVTMARAVLNLNGPINLGLDVNLDYGDSAPSSIVPISGGLGDPWGGIWSVAWGGASAIYRAWNSIRGVGFAIAPRLRVQARGIKLSWTVTDIVYEAGGLL
jgi:hypothetical protein